MPKPHDTVKPADGDFAVVMQMMLSPTPNMSRSLVSPPRLTPLLALFHFCILLSVLSCSRWPMAVSGFSYAPTPQFVIPAPQHLEFFKAPERSSYFGYTIVMRPSSIIVGAPRAQSTLPLQRNVNETGAIYRCILKTVPSSGSAGGPPISDAICNPYIFEEKGNVNVEFSEYTYDSEKRDNQWLGGSMDGGSLDTDKLLVCAPRFMAPLANEYLMHGICYWINDTLTAEPQKIGKISPLRLKTEQTKEDSNERYYNYILSEQGMSAHVSPDNEQFLIGAPGIHNWKGSVIRYYKKSIIDDPSLSRRDTSAADGIFGGSSGSTSQRRHRVARQSEPIYSYESEIPSPGRWDQPNDAYFGYAVSTGYFDSEKRDRLLYVATAPQANEQSGEAYIFDMSSGTITKLYVFRGLKFGEYFGYSVLAEDLNGDGLTDVIVSAPQHSVSNIYDEGAIYVFINQGRFNFERILLTSPVQEYARFGTTLNKLGDINHDGYNDIAVGAPFAGNGSVFIYLGSEKGIRDHPSQRLNAPAANLVQSQYYPYMFGHGLSRGSDIDGNGFNDLAVGAPNAETVFIYRAYPVVKILASVSSQTREIKPDQNRFQVNVCYGISTTSREIRSQDLAMRLVVDPQVKRVRIVQSQNNEVSFNASAGMSQQCRIFDCEVRFSVADIFKPIELELHYDLIHGVPDSADFCDSCAAVDPAAPKIYSEKIIFSTGCASSICVADLKVKSQGLSSTYTLGSTRALSVTYEVTNNGETAYLPQINVTSSNRMSFSKTPSNCKTSDSYATALVCDLNNGQPMAKGKRDSITFTYDVSGISGKSMILTAEVSSTGREQTPEDNILRDVIALVEFTEVEAIGKHITEDINLETSFNTTMIINEYEIKSNGPSNVGELKVVFHIPLSYRVSGTKAMIPIIDQNSIQMQAVYDSQLIGIDYYQNTTQLLLNTYETSTSMSTTWSTDSSGFTKIGYSREGPLIGLQTVAEEVNTGLGMNKIEMSTDGINIASMGKNHQRQRREAAAQTATKTQYAALAHPRSYDLLGEDLKGTLPINRTIVFNCNDPEMTVCVRAEMHVYNFKPEKPITITMKYKVDLNEVNQLLSEPWEFFVVYIGLDVHKVAVAGSDTGKELALKSKIEYNIISKHQFYRTPIWVIILAIIGGLLLLAAMTYGMYRAGFFKRSKKEEMDQLVNQQQNGAPGARASGADAEHESAETEELNSGGN